MNAIVFLGIQGSGKGTQAKLLSELTGYRHVNIGEILRVQIQERTELGRYAEEIITHGNLVSDELVINLIERETRQESKGIIFDGFPRTKAQALDLLHKHNLLRVYYLDLSEEDAVKRISSRRICQNCGENYNLITYLPMVSHTCDACGGQLYRRPDDEPAAIHKRIAEFYKQTHKLRDLFSQRELLVAVPANAPINQIAEFIKQDVQTLIH